MHQAAPLRRAVIDRAQHALAMPEQYAEFLEVGLVQLRQYLDLDGVVAECLGVPLQRQPAQPVGDLQGPSGSCVARSASLTRSDPGPKEEHKCR
jgi:hypothetical protein